MSSSLCDNPHANDANDSVSTIHESVARKRRRGEPCVSSNSERESHHSRRSVSWRLDPCRSLEEVLRHAIESGNDSTALAFKDGNETKGCWFRIEHRVSEEGEDERVLLYSSQRKGVIGKVVFSSSVDRNGQAVAMIDSLHVSKDYRGMGFGRLLFQEATTCLRRRYLDPHSSAFGDSAKQQVVCQLTVEEDLQRYNKLVQFYKRLGCQIKPNTPIHYLTNSQNDMETYRKIIMQIVLSSTGAGRDRSMSSPLNKSLGDSSHRSTRFVPVTFAFDPSDRNISEWNSRIDKQVGLDARCWLVQVGDGSEETRALELCSASGKGLVEGPPLTDEFDPCRVGFSRERIQLMRVTGETEGERTLWTVQSTSGHFMALRPFSGSTLASVPYAQYWRLLWDPCCCSLRLIFVPLQTPKSIQHARLHNEYQTTDYVRSMRDRYLSFSLGRRSLIGALDMADSLDAFPVSMDPGRSLRQCCFGTAEAVRKAGHPDWLQLVGLFCHLGGIVKAMDDNVSLTRADEDYDWTIARSTLIEADSHLGGRDYRTGRNAMRSEDRKGLLFAWTGPEYMYHMLRHNSEVDIPDEGLHLLRLTSLSQSSPLDKVKECYHGLDEDGLEEAFDLFAEWGQLVRSDHLVKCSREDCEFLWKEHYQDIAIKYNACGEFDW